MAHGLSCSAACGIFLDQGLNPCPLWWLTSWTFYKKKILLDLIIKSAKTLMVTGIWFFSQQFFKERRVGLMEQPREHWDLSPEDT